MRKTIPRSWSIRKVESEIKRLRKKWKNVNLKGTGTGRRSDRTVIQYSGKK